MVHESEPRFLVLHALRLKGFAETAALSDASGLPPDEVDRHLSGLAASDLAVHRDGRVSGWQLTPAGKDFHLEQVGQDIERSGARPAVEDAYHRFLDVNGTVLAACTAWQVREAGGAQVVNDHTDRAYDAAVVDRLVALHEQAGPIVADLAARLGRFRRYADRLGRAVTRIVGGDRSWFTAPMVDSYHTVWFELHEDLLCTLGLDRSSETTAQVG